MSADNTKTLAYLNLYAILADLEILCEIDEKAKSLANYKGKEISIGVNVTDGPKGKLIFNNGCKFVPDELGASIGIKLFSCEHFNLMVDGKKNPFPYKGFTKLSFLLKNFIELTNILESYLRPKPGALDDPAFRKASTKMMFYVIVRAMAQIANHDKIARLSAKRSFNGDCQFYILEDGKVAEAAYLTIKDGVFTYHTGESPNPRSFMKFADYDTARGLFDGKIDAMTCVATGKVMMSGMIQQIDNINKVLDRVAAYLA